MPLAELAQEALPDFSTHPDYQQLFNILVTGGQTREQATLALGDLWRKRTNNGPPQQQVGPQPPDPPRQQPQPPPGGEEQPQARQPEQDEPQQLDHAQPHQDPQHAPAQADPLGPQHQPPHHRRPRAPPSHGAPLAPQDPHLRYVDDHDWPAQDKADKRVPPLPPVDLDAESRTMALQHPPTYALDKFRRHEYVPL
jgi:hypothetical protein